METRWIWAAAVLGLLAGGCTTTKQTAPARAASEQLLLSTAADRAIARADFTGFTNKAVFLDPAYFESYDQKYVLGQIRDAISQNGAVLASSASNADIILEPRSGGLSLDTSSSLLGIPASGLPVPFAGAVEIPEIALYRSDLEFSIAKFALLAYARKEGTHFYSSGPLVGKAYLKNYKIIGMISWKRTDVPEEERVKKRHKHKER